MTGRGFLVCQECRHLIGCIAKRKCRRGRGVDKKTGITQAEKAQRTSEHPSPSSTGDERREAIDEDAMARKVVGYAMRKIAIAEIEKTLREFDAAGKPPGYVCRAWLENAIRSLLHADGGNP